MRYINLHITLHYITLQRRSEYSDALNGTGSGLVRTQYSGCSRKYPSPRSQKRYKMLYNQALTGNCFRRGLRSRPRQTVLCSPYSVVGQSSPLTHFTSCFQRHHSFASYVPPYFQLSALSHEVIFWTKAWI